jgi:hypothetical protein
MQYFHTARCAPTLEVMSGMTKIDVLTILHDFTSPAELSMWGIIPMLSKPVICLVVSTAFDTIGIKSFFYATRHSVVVIPVEIYYSDEPRATPPDAHVRHYG